MEITNGTKKPNSEYCMKDHEKAIEKIFNKFSKDQINYVISEHRRFVESLDKIEKNGKTYYFINDSTYENLQKLLDSKSFKSTEPKRKMSSTTKTNVGKQD